MSALHGSFFFDDTGAEVSIIPASSPSSLLPHLTVMIFHPPLVLLMLWPSGALDAFASNFISPNLGSGLSSVHKLVNSLTGEMGLKFLFCFTS